MGKNKEMEILDQIKGAVVNGIQSLFDKTINENQIIHNETRKEFEGDLTIVVFPFVKLVGKSPIELGDQLGAYIQKEVDAVSSFNVVKGFLNLSFTESHWISEFKSMLANDQYGFGEAKEEKVMVEFSSPNTNKPLHLGHIRNNLLGWSTAALLEAAGHEVFRVQVINDRGIHICKSMVAWQRFGNGETPASSGLKGDHLVGKYYVLYSDEEKAQKAILVAEGKDKEEPEILSAARALLIKWEENDPEIRNLWKEMNGWVYAGFDASYKRLGISFDKNYYESETYLLGKELVEEGLKNDKFYKKEDGSVWIDLEDAKLDHKLVLRSDGTSVYMTQDLGTAHERYKDFGTKRMIYVVGDEQNYHFKALFEILKRLDAPFAAGLYHLSYGMVNLPTGRMKSREGTVVDADDLMEEVVKAAKVESEIRQEIEGLPEENKLSIWEKVGIGSLKYFLLRVQPQKSMVFNPEESVSLNGQTGAFIQYAYVRTKGIERKMKEIPNFENYEGLDPKELALLSMLNKFPMVIQNAAAKYDPAEMATYMYDLAKTYNKFYYDVKILKAPNQEALAFRFALNKFTGEIIERGMKILGIDMPERM